MPKAIKLLAALAVAGCLLFIAIIVLGATRRHGGTVGTNSETAKSPKIQVALLLDVSNSMDGLIDQAKAQLWNTVNLLGRAQCNGQSPPVEFALYEYGRPTNPVADGYVRQINGFITDLDSLSVNIFKLKTYGGDEYCAQVISQSLQQLPWDNSAGSYKVIFIAGNESFRQGGVPYTQACQLARRMGVVVNTIFCGSREEGLREYWNLGAECGEGSFTHIDQEARPREIPTPYDTVLFSLNQQLNQTYLSYGSAGLARYERQAKADELNYSMSKSVAAVRVKAKGSGNIYKNEEWDMVDAAAADPDFIKKLDRNTLPDSLKQKSDAELTALVRSRQQQRNALQQEITTVSAKRESFLAKARSNDVTAQAQTLETEMERILRAQAARYHMLIK